MSKYSNISLIPYLFGVLFMVTVGAIVELIRSCYPTIKSATVSFAQKTQKLYNSGLRNFGRKLTVT